MKTQKDIFYTTECALDIYLPKGADYETIVRFHGGGMEKGDKGGVFKRGDDGEFSVVKTVLTWLKGERKWTL